MWKRLSLREKVRFLSVSAAAVVFLSILANIMVASYGLGGFKNILESNSQSLTFWSAIESESRAFASCVREPSAENKEKYDEACMRTGKAYDALPFDYKKTGKDRYARTWSIRNTYESYVEERDAFWQLKKEDEAYTDSLYRIYQIQEYLGSYAGKLEQLTVESGVKEYGTLRSLFIIVPVVSFLWGAAAFFMVGWMERSVKKSIIRPVVELAEDSARIGNNDFSGLLPAAEGGDEIAQLLRAFTSMKVSTEGYITALHEKHEVEKQLDAVRLQMLKNQISPHFLFNTLNMISGTAQIEDAATTEKMITALSRLFRYNLKSTASVMPLERELKVVQDYMYLQQMRFGKRISFTVNCSEDTLEVMIPAFALQPLVENAIIHGLSSKSQGGRIHVRSRLEGKRLWISVADTGVGIEAVRLNQIRRDLAEGEENQTGVGVGNIYRRVHSMYEDGEVEIYSREGRGTVVRMAFTEV